MTSIWKKQFDGTAIKQGLRWLARFFTIYVCYVLSFGPVVWISGGRASTGWNGLPLLVRFAYGPTSWIVPSFLNDSYDHYVQLWMDMEH